MSNHFSELSVGLLTLSMMLAATGCGGGSGNAQLRVLQASPTASSVNLLVDNAVVSSNLGYGANTGYLSVRSGTLHLQVVPTGASTPIVDESVSVPSSGEVTVVVEGVSPSITGLVLTDNNTAPAAGTAQLRLVNAAPSMGTADVYAVAAGSSLISGSPTVAGLAFGQASSYQSLTIPTTSTTQTFSVFFTEPGTTLVLVDTGPITFSAGQNRTVVALNRVGGGFTFATLADLN